MNPTDEVVGGVAVGDDGLARCPWASRDPLLMAYHDDEWGRPVRDERGLFERVVLEGFQAGLSWRTILAKRPAFREAFAHFDPDTVAAFTDERLDSLMADKGIVRNRAKIRAARANAAAVIALRDRGGLEQLVWSHRPAPAEPRTSAEVPTSSPESLALTNAFKRAGISFIGPTSAFALMEAIGMVNTHLVACHRRTTTEVGWSG